MQGVSVFRRARGPFLFPGSFLGCSALLADFASRSAVGADGPVSVLAVLRFLAKGVRLATSSSAAFPHRVMCTMCSELLLIRRSVLGAKSQSFVLAMLF